MSNALLFKAGPGALQDVRKRGFSTERIGTIAGASGGAKWLVLSQLDRVIIEQVLPRFVRTGALAGFVNRRMAIRLLCTGVTNAGTESV